MIAKPRCRQRRYGAAIDGTQSEPGRKLEKERDDYEPDGHLHGARAADKSEHLIDGERQ
jgi:hypothetical protein